MLQKATWTRIVFPAYFHETKCLSTFRTPFSNGPLLRKKYKPAQVRYLALLKYLETTSQEKKKHVDLKYFCHHYKFYEH